MKALVTGAAGMLGQDLVALLRDRGHDVVPIDMEVDITDPCAIGRRVVAERPDAIFHLAAWTDVDGAEANEPSAHAVNALGTRNVAKAAREVGAALVCVSTDYVFAGTQTDGYAEDDPVGPIGAYGRTKQAGEAAAVDEYPDGVRIARTAWLYGAGGNNFVDTMRRLGREREEVTVVADQIGSPTWTKDLAPALIELVTQPPGNYHTAGGGRVTWADFAREIYRRDGIDCAVRDVTTAEFGRPAPRPAVSILQVTKDGAPTLRDWREALRDYLAENPADTTEG